MKTTTQLTQRTLTLTAGAAIALGGLVIGANPAAAYPINPYNPLGDFGASQDEYGSGSGIDCNTTECTLQSELDFYWDAGGNVGPGIDVYNSTLQQTFSTDSVLATLMFEIAGFKEHNRFGVYSVEDRTNTIEIFAGAQSGVTTNSIGLSEMQGLGAEFGFYLTNKNGQTFYSQHEHNPGEWQHAMIYEGNGTLFNIDGTDVNLMPKDLLIAFEDLQVGQKYADWDYQDMVVKVRMQESVPEPSLILGLGAMAGSLFATRKRKRS
jgi:hypothetical protein